MVSTLDFESSDPGSSPGRTSFLPICGVFAVFVWLGEWCVCGVCGVCVVWAAYELQGG